MFDFDIEYIYAFAVVVIIAILYFLTREPKFNPPPEVEKIVGDFTLDQLKKYDGVQKEQVFLAAKGIIYDVTNTTFYRKDGPYGLFAGHDASVNLSKMSHDETLLNQWGKYTLTEEQQEILDDWVQKFDVKYRKVGVVKN